MKKDIFRVLASLTIVSQFMFISAPLISAEEITPDESVVVESQTNDTVVTSDVITDVTTDVTTDATPDAVTEVATPTEETASAETAPVIFPELTTDKADYLVGEIATIFGRFFQSLQNIILKIFGGDVEEGTYTEEIQNVTADDQGSFTTIYQLDNIFRPTYTVTANDIFGTQLVQTTFTDKPKCSDVGVCCPPGNICSSGPIDATGCGSADCCGDINNCQSPTPTVNLAVNIDQCRNGGVASPQTWTQCTGSAWVNGNAGEQNSHYREGESISYRNVITGVGMTGHRVRLVMQYDVVHAGNVAIDYLTRNDRWQNPETTKVITPDVPCPGISGCVLSATVDSPRPTYTVFANPTLNITSASNVAPAVQNTDGGLGYIQQPFTSWGLVNGVVGETEIKFYNVDTVKLPTAELTGTTPDVITALTSGGTTAQEVTLEFTPTSDTVVISWGGHISQRPEWGAANVQLTAGGISGSPYHMANNAIAIDANDDGDFLDDKEDQNIGQQDRSLSAAAVVAAPTIGTTPNPALGNVGDTLNDSATLIGGSSPTGNVTFKLFSPSDPTCSGTPIFTAIDGTAPYTAGVGFVSNAAGTWNWTADYAGDQNNLPASSDCGAEAVTIINPTGHLIVNKITVPSSDTTTEFPISVSGTGTVTPPTSVNLTGGSNHNFEVIAGTYSAAETVPAGWDKTGDTCQDVVVTAGQTAECTITNTKRGHIIVDKVTTGGDATFSFDASGGTDPTYNDFTLTNLQTPNDQVLKPGSYSVTETVPDGWDLSSVSCVSSIQNTEVNTALELDAGETITCTFTDTKKGTIVLVKNTIGGNGTFDFTTTGGDGLSSNPSITTSGGTGSQTYNNITPGSYSVSETVPGGWDLTSATCDMGETPASLDVEPGETVTCTFENTKRGSIIIVKNTTGGNGTFNFTSNFGVTSLTTVSGTAQQTVDNLIPGSGYSISETVPAGWDLTGSSCDHGTISAIEVLAGQTTTCTFSDTKKGHIIVDKVTYPAADSQSFAFTTTGSGYAGFSLTDADDPNDQEVVPGAYSVSETVPGGWDLTSATCDQGETISSLDVEPGETVTCTFTNTKKGHIIIEKNAIPDSSQEFIFNNNFGNGNPATFGLVDDSTPGYASRNSEVLPGKYAVSENAVAGWESPESATCDSGETIGDIDVGPGETVTCLFTNEKLATIILVKNTIGGNGPFDFVMTGTGLPVSDQLTTIGGTAQETYNDLDPDNTYTIAETPIPAGWAKTGASCDNGDPVTAITPNADETITCTFTNNKPAAQIDLAPLDGVNKVGQNHIITATVQVQNGDGNWGPATDGTVVTFSITNSNGATAVFVPASPNTCTTSGGSCTITINSPTAGHVVVHASASPIVLGVTLPVSTGSGGDNSADAQKTYVNAKISITPATFTNEVDDPHDFIVKVEADNGDGTGLQPVNGAIANAIATPAPDGGLNVADCNDGTNASGECTVTINSSIAGVFTIIARSTISVGGVEFKLQTNGVGGNSGPAEKTYVDGSIYISPPSATNKVGEPHTITADVTKDDGSGTSNAVGVTVNFSITSGAATFYPTSADDHCVTDGTGHCSIQIVSNTTGSNTINASVTFNVGGVSITRATNGNSGPLGSGPITKDYVNAKISITPAEDTNAVNDPHTFTVKVQQDTGSGWTDVSGAIVNAIASPTPTSFDKTDCLASTDSNGECSLILNSSVTGIFEVRARTTINVGGVEFKLETNGNSDNSAPAEKTYVNARISITPRDDTNPINESHNFIVKVEADYGDGSGFIPFENALVDVAVTPPPESLNKTDCNDGTNASGECTATINNSAPGLFTAMARSQIEVDGVTFKLATNGLGENSGSAEKTYVAGKIIVEKQTLPDGSSQSFEFDPSWSATNFNLTDGQQNNSGWLSPGNYSVVEIVPTSWDFTSAFCSIEGQIGTFPYTPGENISLGAGNIITCTFTNTQRGHIIVDKVTYPTADPQSFDFTAGGAGYSNFSLTDADDPNDQEVVPGAYSVSETVPGGWDLTSATCDQGETISSLDVEPGETVTCTFTNTKKGKITIVKDAQPNDCKDFTFGGTLGSFVLDDDGDATECIIDPINRDQSKTFENLAINTSYTVNETVPNFWNLMSPIVCTGIDASQITQVANGITINLLPGNEVTCTFVNEKQSPTRTQGFWKTHTSFTSDIFTANFLLPSGMTLGLTSGHYVTIDSTAKLFGAWYSDVNFETTIVNKKQVKRDPIEKARILLAHQLITAKLNCAAFGGCPTSINSMIASADAAYAGTNIGAMNTAMSALDAFNNSGDTIIISPPLPWQGKATPKDSQSLAQSGIPSGIAFWDQP